MSRGGLALVTAMQLQVVGQKGRDRGARLPAS